MDVLISKGPAKAPPVPGRHVDKLDTLPDELLKKQDEAYLVCGEVGQRSFVANATTSGESDVGGDFS